jgi:site-specific DNA-methyltransferase (adenine-specific)
MTSINYNPDVLLCLANLSNDEVFTPPELANSILDLLPKDIWKNKDAKFFCVFKLCRIFIFLACCL